MPDKPNRPRLTPHYLPSAPKPPVREVQFVEVDRGLWKEIPAVQHWR